MKTKSYHVASGRNFASILLRLLPVALLMLLAGDAWAQANAGLPSKTSCKGWDDAFLSTFHTVLVLVLLGTCLLGLLLPLLIGRYFWWITAARARIFWITAAMLVFSVFGVVVYPRLLGLGGFGYSAVDERYLDCEGVSFGATGLFGGLIGEGVAAISQWPAMSLFLLAAAIVGGLLAFLISEALIRSLGITSKVSGGTA
jgi:hypothetical protein